MSRRLAALFAWCALPLAGADLVSFPPGGAIRVENSYGYLTVEGWDQAQVEVTVTKSDGQVRVVTERRSGEEVVISTVLPHRANFLAGVVPWRHRRGAEMEYTIHVPRDSHLFIHHDSGYVSVSDVTGSIEVSSRTGDMIVMLPDPGAYAIDARTRLGRIDSDLSCRRGNPLLAGGRLICTAPATAPRVRLRMGRGSIEIKNGSAAGPFE